MSEPTYYETMYILRPDIPEDEVDSHLKKYSEILEKADAKILDNQMRGKRRLAYAIGKYKEGVYVQLSHTGDGSHVESLEKSMRLSEDVIRYLTVKQYGALPAKRAPKASDSKETNSNEDKDLKEAKETKSNEEKDLKETSANAEKELIKNKEENKEGVQD